jgi:small subunit ribosomal protein S16
MLVIRMQRTGRSGHAQFRVVVQDSRRTPTSGKIVAQLGHYDPHTKQTVLDKEKAQFYLDHGAQPSERVARLLKSEGVKLPTWVSLNDAKAGKIRNQEKLRRNRPAEEAAPAEEPAAEAVSAVEEPAAEPAPDVEETAPAEPVAEEAAPAEAEKAPAEEPVADAESSAGAAAEESTESEA